MIAYLVRHTSVSNDRKLCYGQTEIELAGSFEEEAKAIAKVLPAAIDACISSPSERCMRLAHYLHKTVQPDSNLQELDFGEWEQQPWGAINRQELDYWAADFVNRACPGGESFAQLDKRAVACWERLAVHYSKKTVVIVTHAGVVRALLAHVGGRPLQKAFEFAVPPGFIAKVAVPAGTIEVVTSHANINLIK